MMQTFTNFSVTGMNNIDDKSVLHIIYVHIMYKLAEKPYYN